MSKRQRQRFVALLARLHGQRPDIDAPIDAIEAGYVQVDGRVIANPRAMVRRDAAIRVRAPVRARGAAKLEGALAAFSVEVEGRVAADLGASTGGFTAVLLEAGAARVYAIDAGFGQLLGSLRADPRVVSLERLNVGELSPERVPDVLEVITIDLSYLAIAEVAPQLQCLLIAEEADVIALVKPMYELGLAHPPTTADRLAEAVRLAGEGLEVTGWRVMGWVRSPVPGRRGAVEFLLHARRQSAMSCPPQERNR